MAHTPHTWNNGDTITAVLLNTLEADLAAAATAASVSNVNNTSDAGKPVSTAQQAALDLKAPLASPAFTGTPTIAGTAVAKTTDITAAISGLVGAAPAALDTLKEIDDQLAADEGSAAALAALVNTKAALLTTAATRTVSATLAVDTVNPFNATSGPVTGTLPTPTKVGQVITVEKIDTSSNLVTIAGTIRGATSTITLSTQYESIVAVAESLTSWRPIAGHRTKTALEKAFAPHTAEPLALTEFMIERLRTFLDWCHTNNATPYIGEVGWPSDTVKPGEGAGWNDLGEKFYTLLDEYGVAATFYDATKRGVGDPNRAYGASTITAGGTMGGTLDSKYSQATVLERHTTAALRGVNMADAGGANLRVNGATTTFYMGNAGTLNTDYQYPTQADFAYLTGLGYRIFRLPIFLERLLTAPGSTLVTAELTAIQNCVAACAAAGGKVILDCHGFGQVGVAGTVYQVGSGTFSYGNFTDFWTKISTAFKGNPGVQAYGLMNEPWGGGSYGLYTVALQQAITAIRGNSDTTTIAVATDNFDIQGMPATPYTDPASNLWYEAHIYPDFYGTYTSSLRNFEVQAKNMAALAPGRDYPVATAATIIEETMPRFMGNSNFTPASGTLNLWYFTALGGHTVSKVYLKTRGTAAAGVTFASIGLYLVNSDDSVTLLTSTATDNTLFTATFTNYTKTFAPTQPLMAGQRYALGLLIVGTTMPILYGCGSLVDPDISPRITGQLAGQASLPASVTIGSITSASGGPYARLF